VRYVSTFDVSPKSLSNSGPTNPKRHFLHVSACLWSSGFIKGPKTDDGSITHFILNTHPDIWDTRDDFNIKIPPLGLSSIFYILTSRGYKFGTVKGVGGSSIPRTFPPICLIAMQSQTWEETWKYNCSETKKMTIRQVEELYHS
jgi:hypothetical protein